MNDAAVHLRHCFQGEHESNCKYGEDETCPAKPNIVTNKPEWMPINPCDDCSISQFIKDNGCIGIQCRDYSKYLNGIDNQKKLLEYLIRWFDGIEKRGYAPCHQEDLKEMLKQLEKKQ